MGYLFNSARNGFDITVMEPIETTINEMSDIVFSSDYLSDYTVLVKRNNLTYYLWSDTRLNARQQTYVVTHGWNSAAVGDKDFRALVIAIKAYDAKANVLFVEWTKYSNTLKYATAASGAFKVGLSIAIALLELGLNVKTTRLIGHRLGGHVMGSAGAEYIQRSGQAVPAIIALDPAGPDFESMGSSKRLDTTDAKRVIALHSTATLSYDNALGDLDIYLNNWNDDNQPGADGLTAIKPNHNYPILLLTDLFNGYAFRQRDQSLFTCHDLHTRLGSHHIDTHIRV